MIRFCWNGIWNGRDDAPSFPPWKSMDLSSFVRTQTIVASHGVVSQSRRVWKNLAWTSQSMIFGRNQRASKLWFALVHPTNRIAQLAFFIAWICSLKIFVGCCLGIGFYFLAHLELLHKCQARAWSVLKLRRSSLWSNRFCLHHQLFLCEIMPHSNEIPRLLQSCKAGEALFD